MVAGAGGVFFGGGFEAGSVAPGTIAPFGEDAFVTTGTDMAEPAAGIIAVSGARTPGADDHGFVDRFGAVRTA